MDTEFTELSLEQLESQSILDLAEEIGRPLHRGERNAFRWILWSFEAETIKDALRSCPRPKSSISLA